MRLKTKRLGLPAVLSAAAALGFAGAADAQISAKIGDTTVSVGGYVKLDVIYDIDQSTGDTQDPPTLEPGRKDGDRDFRLHARQSRIWVKTARPSAIGDVRTHIEGDFFGGGGNEVFSNSRGFRLRHAYGAVGGLLMGQTWTNFMQFTAYPDTVDFNGPQGTSFIRQAQARYTSALQGVPGKGEWSVSIENPEVTGVTGARDRSPDLTARVKWGDGPFALEASGVLRFLRARTATGSSSTTGYGGMVSASYAINTLTVMGNVIGGDGIGRYLYESFGSGSGASSSGIGDVFIKSNGKIEGVNAYGYQAAVKQQWAKEFSSGLSYGRTKGDRPGPAATDRLESAHFSNFYTPVKGVTFGGELSWQRKVLDSPNLSGSRTANAKRIQFSGQVDF